MFFVGTGEVLCVAHRYLREIAQYIATLGVKLTRLEIHHATASNTPGSAAAEPGPQNGATGLEFIVNNSSDGKQRGGEIASLNGGFSGQ